MAGTKSYFLCLLFIVSSYSYTFVLCERNFKITRANVCPPRESRYVTLQELSVEQCADECARRKSCTVIGYIRLFRLCELHVASSSPLIEDKRCILITREDIKVPKCNNCSEGKMCEDGKCKIQAISLLQPPLNSRTVSGNMNFLGTKRIVECATGFFEIRNDNLQIIRCSEHGLWNNDPYCQECPAPETWIKFPRPTTQSEFMFSEHKMSHAQANENCLGQNAHLIRFGLNEWWKWRYIKSILTSCQDFVAGPSWTDGTKDDNGTWKYSNGENVPTDDEHKYYWREDIALAPCLQVRNKLKDRNCDADLRCICERDYT